MPSDERFNVVAMLKQKLRQKSISDFAKELGITVLLDGRINKGWIGQTLDRLAETETVNAQLPDGLDYELKSVHFIPKHGELVPKETMAITMFNPEKILSEVFEESHLWQKLSRLILVGHTYPEGERQSAEIKFLAPVDVSDRMLRQEIETYWKSVKDITERGEIARYSSKGTSAGYIQLRTKGTGTSQSRCPVTGALFNTRAFYATKVFLKYVRGTLN